MGKRIAIMMADLSGYTAMTEIHGAEKAAFIIHHYEEAVKTSLCGNSSVLERVGDQIVVVSENADDLARTAIELQRNVARIPHFLPVHAGLHYGEVFEQNGSYFGSTINLTARIAAKANKGTILASMDFVESMSNPQLFPQSYFGIVRFKNILESKEIVKFNESGLLEYSDPVCRMQLSADELQLSVQEEKLTHYFCSDECVQLFKKNKEYFLQTVA